MSILDIFRKWIRPHEQAQPQTEDQTQPHSKPRERYILCIDGGGIRGIIPVVYLKTLEQKIRSLGGRKRLTEYFDLVAGTSTGGLISISLTCPSSLPDDLDELARIYRTMGRTIFPATPIPGLRQLATSKYPPTGIESLLCHWFSDATLGQATTPTLLMTYNLSTGQASPLRSYIESSFPVWKAGRATSAAPTYFPPVETEHGLLVDGGVIANNPSVYAYMESRSLYPDCPRHHILSLSTGGRNHTMRLDDTFGLVKWADNVAPMYSTAQKETCDQICRSMTDLEYIRIDTPLNEEIRMDETNPEIIFRMERFAQNAIKEYDSQIDSLARELMTNQGEDILEEKE